MSDDKDKNYPELDPKEVAKRLEKEKNLIVVDDKGRSLTSGKFIKGAAKPGPGRPKKIKPPETTDLLTEEDRAAFLQDGKVHSKAALQRLLETAQTRAEAVKIASLLIQYDAPKLSAVETKSTEDKTVTISWNITSSPSSSESLPKDVSETWNLSTSDAKEPKLVRSEETEKETNLIGAPEPDLKIVDGDCLEVRLEENKDDSDT